MVAIGPKTWNANVTAVDGDSVTLDVRSKWVNYHDGGGLWLPIESTWQAASNGECEHTASNWSLIAPATATGRIATYNEGDFDIFTGGPITLTRTPALELEHVGVSPVSASYDPATPWEVRYSGAFGNVGSLLLRTWHRKAMRPTHVFEIIALPEGGGDFEVVERVFTSMRIPGWDGSAIDIGSSGAGMVVVGDSYGMGMKPAVAWYRDAQGELVTQPISVIATRYTGYVELRKIVPRWFIEQGLAAGATAIYADETLTVNPDPNVETTTFDSYYSATGANVTWTTLSGAASASTTGDAVASGFVTAYTSTATSNRWSNIYRAGYGFDTSSIGSGATISSATFSVYGASKSSSFPSGGASAYLCKFTPGSNTAAATGDFGTVDKTLQSDGGFAYSGWSTTAYNDFVLNATGLGNINKTGQTWFMLLSANDQAASAPGWSGSKQTDLSGYYADQTGTANDPKLVVTYTAGGGGGGTSGNFLLLGVG